MPVCSGDSNTHSQNLVSAESPSQIELTTGVPLDHDNQEAPIITSAKTKRETDLTTEVPNSHEDNPEVLNNAAEMSHATVPEDPYTANRWAEPTQREHKCRNYNQYFETEQAMRSHEFRSIALCVTCQQCFSSKREKYEHIKSHQTCR
jgi:hypothetical protein